MALGYSGYAQIYSGNTPVTVLVTNMSIGPELNPINSSSAVGFGWLNAADMSHYANGVMNYRGSLSFDMSATTSVWTAIKEWALTQRVYPKSFLHSPDGTRVYSYMADGDQNATSKKGAWCGSFRLNTSQDSVVAADLDVLALIREETVSGNGYFNNPNGYIAGTCANLNATSPLNPSQGNISPIPFWKTNAQIIGAGTGNDAEVVMWSVNNNNSPQIIKTCNGLDAGDFGGASGYGFASAVVMGPMSVDGSVQLYSHSGVWDPVLDALPIYADTTSFEVEIDAGGTTLTITVPAIKLESDSYDFNVSGPVMRTFNFKGLGGKCTGGAASAPMLMS